jgi:nucleotide-binding universal stress UspA family protein
MSLDRIVVGVDGSHESDLALAWAIDVASATGGHVTAVHALGLLEHVQGELMPSQPRRSFIADDAEAHLLSALRDTGVTGHAAVRDGSPVDVILGVAADEAADLIVVGRRGSGHGSAQDIGSTSTRLSHVARCPLVII